MFWSNGIAELHQADARAIPLPDASVHCVITSPPYWGLRDYGLGEWTGGDSECDHQKPMPQWATDYAERNPKAGASAAEIYAKREEPWPSGVCGKCGARQQAAGIGLEPTLGEWLANIVAVGREVRRVLRDDGTFWLNLGDAYAGSGKGMQADGTHSDGEKQATNVGSLNPGKRTPRGAGSGRWGMGDVAVPDLPAKNLMGQPWRVAFALQDDGWYLRSAIVWHKPNPMPESVSDRPTNAYEMVFLLAKRPTYFYDAEAVRESANYGRGMMFRAAKYENNHAFNNSADAPKGTNAHTYEGGRNARNVWTIPTQGRPEAHFATFPDELPRRCILAGTSEYGVCADCGAPWVRVVEKERYYDDGVGPAYGGKSATGPYNPQITDTHDVRRGPKVATQTLGWQPTCDCGADRDCPHHAPAKKQDGHGPRHAGFNARWKENGGVKVPPSTGWHPGCTCDAKRVPATILDPFVGSGTTVAVAQQLGRRGIGLDLNPEYLAIAQKRLEGMPLPIPTEAYECQTLTTESHSSQARLWT